MMGGVEVGYLNTRKHVTTLKGTCIMEQYKKGIWTPWAKVVCYECHGNENLPKPKTDEEWERFTRPQGLKYGNAVTFCDDCHSPVQLDDSVAMEHNLVEALRQRGFEAHMAQTGGMMSACSIEPSEELKGGRGPDDVGEILVTYNDSGDGLYWMGAYDSECGPLDPEWANISLKSQDEMVAYVCKHQEKFAKLESPEKERPLGDLVQEAREKAAEINAEKERGNPRGPDVFDNIER